MKLLIERIDGSDKQTIGNLFLLDDEGFINKEYNSLELPYKENKHDISCIPIGNYKCVKRYNKKHGHHLHILDVPNRTYILIHSGNFYTDILGCVLIGKDLSDINNDGYIDVINSRQALDELLLLIPNEIDLEIK